MFCCKQTSGLRAFVAKKRLLQRRKDTKKTFAPLNLRSMPEKGQ